MLDLAPAERIEWRRADHLPGVEILLADNCARRWRIFHETFTTCTGLSISEPADWRYRGKVHSQTADGLQLIEPGEVHTNVKITRPASFRVLMVDAQTVRQIAIELGMDTVPHLRLAQLNGGPVYQAFRMLHCLLETAATPLEQQCAFQIAMRMMLEHCAERRLPNYSAPARRPAVQRARAYIDAHYSDSITLDEIVRAAGDVGRFHLVHSFTREVGLPPHLFQLQLRLTRARMLLAEGRPAADCAALLGFADQSHFGRHFRRAYGVTPGRYAAMMRA